LVFQHFDCSSCDQQLKIWEEIARSIKDYVHVARLDATQAPDLVEELGVSQLPQFVSVKRENNSYRVIKLSSGFRNAASGVSAVFRHWKANIAELNSLSILELWLKSEGDKSHFVLFQEKGDRVDFKYVASILKSSALFAISRLSAGSLQKVMGKNKIDLPTVAVFRGQMSGPILVSASGGRLLVELEDFASPLFATLSSANFERLCGEWCVGAVANDDVNQTMVDARIAQEG
jgi:hypothetical protein